MEAIKTGQCAKKFEVWVEGYACTGESGTAQRIARKGENTIWEGRSFQEACENALKTLDWDMDYYNTEVNTYWGCSFFDNESEARKLFG